MKPFTEPLNCLTIKTKPNIKKRKLGILKLKGKVTFSKDYKMTEEELLGN